VRDRADRLSGAVGSYSQGAPRAGLNPGEAVRTDIAFGPAVSWQGIRASGDQHGPCPEGYDLAAACSSGSHGLPERVDSRVLARTCGTGASPQTHPRS